MAVAGALLLAAAMGAGQASAQNAARGQDLLREGQYSQAREAFEAALSAGPGDTQAQAGEVAASEKLALQARATGNMDGALRDLLRAKQYAPENPKLLFDLSVLEDQMGLYRDADATLVELARQGQLDAQAEYALARVKMDLGQLGPAETAMRAYLKQRPDDASAHYGLGRILQLGQKPEAAAEEFRRSAELQPQQTEAYYQLGQIALEAGQYDEAIAEFAKTLAGDPGHGGALAGTGTAYFRQKKYPEAEKYLRQAVAAAPDYQPGHYYLGLTLARLGQKDESARELAEATRLADVQNQKEAQRLRLNPQ